jgi:hypothetical protein
MDIIPMGQPILVGHHSEKRHRKDIKKLNKAMDKSFEALGKKEYYEEKIEKIEKNKSISGDNPEAVNLYQKKMEMLEKQRENMKEANKYWRKNGTMVGCEGISEETAIKTDKMMETAYSWIKEKGPYAEYRINNISAEIRRIKVKIEELSKLGSMEEGIEEYNWGEFKINREINRVQFLFEGKPEEGVRSKLKENGFRWSPAEGAWQRQLTENAIRASRRIIEEFNKNIVNEGGKKEEKENKKKMKV